MRFVKVYMMLSVYMVFFWRLVIVYMMLWLLCDDVGVEVKEKEV